MEEEEEEEEVEEEGEEEEEEEQREVGTRGREMHPHLPLPCNLLLQPHRHQAPQRYSIRIPKSPEAPWTGQGQATDRVPREQASFWG